MRHTLYSLLALTLVGCCTTKTTTTTTTNTKDAFSIALMQQSVQENKNVFLSPASAAMALNMLTPGAQGATRSELETIVPSVELDTTEWLQIASALWINEGLNVKPAFLQANATAEVYNGKITAPRVNQWASDKTHGKITQVLQEPLPPIEMALTNALYFKADWADPFRESGTSKESFYSSKNETKVDMMHQTSHFPYIETASLQAVRLYYAAPYCMEIYLPKKGHSLESIIDDLSALRLDTMESSKVELSLPKVKFEYEQQLNDYLKAMGLKTCFTSEADFSDISTTPLYVDFVTQNTYLSIDEAGTEAAAVTAIGLAKMAWRPEPEKIYKMQINRPFLLVIRENRSAEILFYGVIQNL